MTTFLQAQAASNAVHDLSHSSVGTDISFVRVDELPPTTVSLGDAAAGVVAGLAARRLGTAEDHESTQGQSDAALFDLIERHEKATDAWSVLVDATEEPFEKWKAACPPRPQALYYRMRDDGQVPKHHARIPGSDRIHILYESEDIERLRTETPRVVTPYEVQAAKRRAEVIATFDLWEAQKEELKETTGLKAAGALLDAAQALMDDLGDRALDCVPHTFAGLQAKARWAVSMPWNRDFNAILVRDLCRLSAVGVSAAQGSEASSTDRRDANEPLTALGIPMVPAVEEAA